jgi:hypothetical protein
MLNPHPKEETKAEAAAAAAPGLEENFQSNHRHDGDCGYGLT